MKLTHTLYVWSAFLALACPPALLAANPEKVSAPGGCPTVTHIPVISVVRGTPAVITAKIECPTGEVVNVTLYVRLTDLGKPSPVSMTGEGDAVYKAIVPVSMVQGVSRFWYYIDAQGMETEDQGAPGIAQTRWHPVNIIEHGEFSEGGAGGGKKAAYLLLGAAGAGGAYLIYDHNKDGDDDGNNPPPPPPAPPANEDEEEDEDEDEDEDAAPVDQTPSCIVTGSETASADPGTACDTGSDIGIYVCDACPGATISAEGDWSASDSLDNYNNEACPLNDASPALFLPQPPNVPSVSEGQYTITVRANGQVIATIPWPGDSYFDCF